MKILLVSDHEESYIWDYFDRERFKDVELIISCGDLKAEYLSFLVTLIKAPLLYVPGNHDGRYLKTPPEGCVSIHKELITYKGIRILGIGGSYCYNDGEYQYTEAQMKRMLLKITPKIWWNKGMDIIVSHAPAYQLGDGMDQAHRGFEAFRDLLEKYSPKFLVHGHQHLNYGNTQRLSEYKNTKIINACGYYIFDY